MRNPYLLPKHKLYKYIENLIDENRLILESKISQIASDKKDSISRRKQSNLSPLSKKFSSSGIGNFKQSIDGQLSSIHDLTQNRFSKITTPMANFQDQISAGLNQNQESRGKITPRKAGEDQNQGASSVLDEKIVKLEQDFQDLINISSTLLEQVEQSHYHEQPVKRKYYQLSILKKVITYKPFESFGELALIQNKRRAAKLQVTGKSDAYFAVLSKKDYKQAHHKAQNEILQSNIAFLRKFIIFQNLSDHALSGLTYIMKEVKCQRGQKIYREGLDIANKIYLVKQGEFISFKKIEVDNTNTNQHLNDIGHFVKNELKNEKSDDVEFNATHHVQKFKLQQTNQKNLVKPQKQVQQIEICIHGQFDIFGFQELLAESTQPMRSQSVQCLQPNSIMVSIDKADLNIHIRRNPAIFEMLIKNWAKLISKRLNQTANKGQMSIIKEQKQLSKSTDIDHNQSIRRLIEEKKNKEQKMKETVSNDNWSNSPQSIKIRKESKDVSLQDSIVIDQQQMDQVKSNQINLMINSKQDEIVTQQNSEFKFHNQHSQNSHQKQSVLPKIEPNFNFDSKKPVNIINQNKKELDVNYSDFRQSIQGSVSPKEYNRVRKMESYIQNILRKKQNIKDKKNYDLAGVKVSGSVQNQQVVLKSQNLNKSIRMQQSVFQFQQKRPSTIQSHYSSQMATSQINNDNQVAKSTFQLPSLKSQEAFEKSLNVELLNNSKLNETSLDNLNQFEKQLKQSDKMIMKRQTAHNISLIKSQSSNNIQLHNLNSISNTNAYHLNTTIQFNSALSSTKNHNIPKKASNQQSINVKSIKGNSLSHAFTKDASDWNKESAIVQDQVSKFLFKNNRQNTTERPQMSIQKLQFNQHLQMSQNQSNIDGLISQDLSGELLAQQTLTQASIPNYSEMAIDQGDVTDQQKKINNHKIIQRKIQQSAIKDYSFEQDIKQLIQTKKIQDKSLSNLMVSSPRSQRNDAHLGNLKLEAQLSQHNKSQLEIKQQISRDAQKILLNPLLIKESTQQRFATSGLKHRNYDENYNVRQDLMTNSKSLTAAQTSSVLQRKVLNVYKRFAHSKQDIFVANVARASIDQDSLTVPQTHQIQDFNKHYNSVSNFNKFEPKSILLRYRQYNSKLEKINKTSNPLNDTYTQSTQTIPHKKSKKQDVRQKSETREINKNNQLSLPKIIMRQIVYEKDDLNQNTLVEHDHMRKLYLEQLTEGTSAHNKWQNKEPNQFVQPIRNRNLNNNKQNSNSKKINNQQISLVDKDMINQKSVSKTSESSLQTSEEQLASSQQQDTSQNQKDSNYKDVILKKQLRDTNLEQKSQAKKKKKKKKKALKHIKTIEFGKKSYSVESEDNSRQNRNQAQSKAIGHINRSNQYKDYTSDMGNQEDKILRKQKNRSQQPKDIQTSQQQLHDNQLISDTKQAKIDLNNVSRQIKDKNINQIGIISNMSETPYQTDEQDYPYKQDSQKEIQYSQTDNQHQDHEPYTDDDHDSQNKEDKQKQNHENEDQSENDDEKTFDVKDDHEFGNEIIPEVSIKNELQDDPDNQQSNLMKDSQQVDQTSSNNKSMPPAYVIMKKRAKKNAGRSQESRNSKYSHDPSSKSKRTISNNTNDKMNVTADSQRFKDITNNLIGNVDGSSIQPDNSLSPIGSKRLQKGFAGFTGNTTMRLNDELLQEDYVLPEYRQNARRLTKEEVDALHLYNKQNLKKFNEEMTGGIKIENKYSRNYNSTKQT